MDLDLGHQCLPFTSSSCSRRAILRDPPGPGYQEYGPLIAQARYEPAGFKARLGLKDVGLALAAGEAATAPMPLGSLIRDSLMVRLRLSRPAAVMKP
jgi:hypothetical protein